MSRKKATAEKQGRVLSTKVTADQDEKIVQICAATGKCTSEILRDALDRHLDEIVGGRGRGTKPKRGRSRSVTLVTEDGAGGGTMAMAVGWEHKKRTMRRPHGGRVRGDMLPGRFRANVAQSVEQRFRKPVAEPTPPSLVHIILKTG